MQIWAETGKSALPIHNYSQILYQFLTFTQNLKWSRLAHPFIMKKTYTTDRIFGSMERQRAIVKKCIPLKPL